MSLSSVLLALCAIAFQARFSLQNVIIPEDDFACIPAAFPADHVCKTLFPNLTSIMAPSPSQIIGGPNTFNPELSFSNSLKNFSEWKNLLTGEDQCSNKIATLLCFFFFPSCTEVRSDSGSQKYVAFPCQSLCQEVTALGSQCTSMLPKSWGPYFLGCNYTYGTDINGHTRNVYTEDTCVNQTHPSYHSVKYCPKIDRSKFFRQGNLCDECWNFNHLSFIFFRC